MISLLTILPFSAACLLQPAPLPPQPANLPGALRLRVADEQLRAVVCPAFASTPEVLCGGEDMRSAAESSEPATPVVHLRARLIDSSRDGWRNAGISLVSLTTALVVSTSGTVEFIATGTQPGSRYKWRSEGRVGMWSVIPFYTGFAGTLIGTALNEYRLPDRLKADCALLQTGQNRPEDLLSEFDPCAEYRLFLRDSYAGVHAPLSELLAHIHRNSDADRAERSTNGERP